MTSTIRVASYNMRKAIGLDRRRRPERTLDVLNELDADVIALQEADRRFGSRASAIPPHMFEEHSDYRPVPLEARSGSLGWHGNALLVKKHVDVLDKDLVHLPSLEPRGAVLADLRVDGTLLRVVGMHLDLSGCGADARHMRSWPISPPRWRSARRCSWAISTNGARTAAACAILPTSIKLPSAVAASIHAGRSRSSIGSW
jgi:hypothetical protein